MSSRLKVMNLLLEEGSLNGLLTVEDSSWNNGTLLSCPREKVVSDLIGKEETERCGIYLLLSRDKVYVGQATQLKKRITQHLLGKDWWERVVLLTTKTDELNKSDIDYIESILIEKSETCHTLDSDNKNLGNKRKVDKFRQAILDEYIDEALFVLELIGVEAFLPNKKHKTNSSSLIPSIPKSSKEAKELRGKKETIDFLENRGIKINSYYAYAHVSHGNNFYLNPRVDEIKKTWYLILNDDATNFRVTFMEIPANSFELSTEKVKGKIHIRKDKPFYFDLNLDIETYIDKMSGINFSKFIKAKYEYGD